MERSALADEYGEPSLEKITNGFIVQLFKNSSKSPTEAATSLIRWLGIAEEIMPAVRAKILRCFKRASSLRGTSLVTFSNELFELPTKDVPAPETLQDLSNLPDPQNSPPPRATTPPLVFTENSHRSTPQKNLNLLEHNIIQKERQLRALQNKFDTLRAKVKNQTKFNSQYAVPNVKKREERNNEMKVQLRAERNIYKRKAARLEEENLRLKQGLRQANEINRMIERKVGRQKNKIKTLRSMTKKQFQLRKRREPKCTTDCLEICPEQEERKVVKAKHGGEYNESVRLCVMELAGLEVATGNMASVMRTVVEACDVTFDQLPSRAACQRIIDEGHVLAKSFLREKVMKRCQSFGLHKDGTQRKKVKILDTSIRTESGESFCLGWSSVASETGEAIAEGAKDKLGELAGTAVDEEEWMKEMLDKLAYFMNDRAANEKKSNRLLEEWRAECLESCSEEEIKKVHHLYCSAHVLLAFHSYSLKELSKLKEYESGMYKHPVTTMLCDASYIFGPVGDHRGVRMQWEAFCMGKGIKSTIQNYKDNRFNGLFETAAQVYHHLEDFLTILSTLKSKNAKQTRLEIALKNPKLVKLIECLGLFFHKVTGPFWTIVVSPKANFENLRPVFQNLTKALEKCTEDPAIFFQKETFAFMKDLTSSAATKQNLSQTLQPQQKEIIEAIARGILNALKVQLADFLEDGVYGTFESVKDLPQMPVTNLVCERHFGHLDASQKRRPHSSLHHHSSVMLLKQTSQHMKRWLKNLPKEKREALLKTSRDQGSLLRAKHRQQDREAIMGCLPTLKLCTTVPDLGLLKQGQLVAVACEDTWYPAAVVEESTGHMKVKVKFATLGKGLRVFSWPIGKAHEISRKSILEKDLESRIVSRGGGRSWLVENVVEIQEKFEGI
ncbi:hypothetical protein ElyMa_003541400 [Elysia marginata]|uniref:Uncharacterized protein n=1 Tax=Elysia marginata TaxID=1093978 RepID=A0AAV4EII9_9GAST|nr:hypothetical protein ElyMa_003541400 [Elysia marginata]